MTLLFQTLIQRVEAWRATGHEHEDFPAIGETVEYTVKDLETGRLRYLLRIQFRALDTYSHLRLVMGTPRVKRSW